MTQVAVNSHLPNKWEGLYKKKSKANIKNVINKAQLAMWMRAVPTKSKLRVDGIVDSFWVAELQVRQVKIGSKSCFAPYVSILSRNQLLKINFMLNLA